MASPERTIYSSDLVTVGEFRCPVDHASFAGGYVASYLLVFPRTAVRIERAGKPPVLADPSTAVVYEPHSEYHRFAVDSRGDECDYFAFPEEVACDPAFAAVIDQGQGRIGAPVYLAQRHLVERAGDALPDQLGFEEAALQVLDAALRNAAIDKGQPPKRLRTHEVRERLAMDAAEYLAANYTRPIRLGDLARQVGSSAYHLARIFREQTGTTIHRRVTELRLRRSLELLRHSNLDIAQIAVHLGFSSHSHFSNAFRAGYGVTPSRFRSGNLETRKIVQAAAS